MTERETIKRERDAFVAGWQEAVFGSGRWLGMTVSAVAKEKYPMPATERPRVAMYRGESYRYIPEKNGQDGALQRLNSNGWGYTDFLLSACHPEFLRMVSDLMISPTETIYEE